MPGRATTSLRHPRARVCAALLAVGLASCGREATPPEAPARGADVYLTPDTREIEGEVPRNATLAGLLYEHLAPEHASSAVQLISSTFDPRKFREGQTFALVKTTSGALREFRYEIDPDQYLRVAPASYASPSDLRAEVNTYARTEELTGTAGAITSETPSLFESMSAAGEGDDLSIGLAAVFSGEIDFNSELREGDHYRVAFRKITRETGTVAYGDVLAAEFFNDGRHLKAFRFVMPDGKAGYYDENGRSLKRFFLKSPLKFEPRISSRFSMARRHPVLNITRAHPAVDYAAPVGSSVVAVSNGTVTRAGWAGDAGRLVAIRHAGGYESMYLHLSRINVRVGQRVSQGEVIGLSGATGLVSGPHLDYRLRKNGAYVNPITEHRRMPPGDPIPAAHMAAFLVERDKLAALLPPDALPALSAGSAKTDAPPPATSR